jgi:TPR repeat protein
VNRVVRRTELPSHKRCIVTNTESSGLQEGIEAFQREEYDRAFDLLLPIAQQGNAEAQCIVGDMYWLGWGTGKDFQEAMRYFLKSAQQGHPNACNTLGCLYTTGGPGLEPSPEKANLWYRKAVENGFDMYDKEWVEALYS